MNPIMPRIPAMAIIPHSDIVGIGDEAMASRSHVNSPSPSKALETEKPLPLGKKHMLLKSRSNALFSGPGSPVSSPSVPQEFAES